METKDNPSNTVLRKYLQKSSDNVLIIRESYRLQRFKNILQKYNVALKSIKSKGKNDKNDKIEKNDKAVEKNDKADLKEIKEKNSESIIDNNNIKSLKIEEYLKNDQELNHLVDNQIKGYEISKTIKNINKFEEQVSITNSSNKNKKSNNASKVKMNTDNNKNKGSDNDKNIRKPNFYNSINKKVKIKLNKQEFSNINEVTKIKKEQQLEASKNDKYRVKSSFKITNNKLDYPLNKSIGTTTIEIKEEEKSKILNFHRI